MSKFLIWMKNEMIEAIPAFFYFVISFNLINFTEHLMLRNQTAGLGTVSYIAATIGAILVVKVLIIVNTFHFINAFPNKPLIYNITWKFIIYNLCVFIFRVVEDFGHLYWHYRDLDIATMHIIIKLHSPIFWAVQLWLMMLFVVYIVFNDLNRKLGQSTIRHLIFGDKTS